MVFKIEREKMKNVIKKIAGTIVLCALSMAYHTIYASVQNQAVFTLFNWPTSFLQPGYQMELGLPLGPQVYDKNVVTTIRQTSYLYNFLQTQGYCAGSYFAGQNLYLQRPNLSMQPTNPGYIVDFFGKGLGNSVVGWSDFLFALRSNVSSVNKNGEIITGDTITNTAMKFTGNLLGYANYYSNSLSGLTTNMPTGLYVYFNDQGTRQFGSTVTSLKQYMAQRWSLFLNDRTKPFTTLSVGSFTPTLPGFCAQNESSTLYFANLFINSNPNVTNSFAGTNGGFLGSLYSYTPVGKQPVLLGSTNAFLFPLLMLDPGNAGVPAGWTFANQQSNFAPIKANLMTDFSNQLQSTQNVLALGS